MASGTGMAHTRSMTRVITTLALLASVLVGAPQQAATTTAHSAAVEPAELVTSCATHKRARGYVTRITRPTGVERVVNLRLKDRVFTGEYVWHTVRGRGPVVRCRVAEGGVVRLATKGRSLVLVVPPVPLVPPAPPTSPTPPSALATWDGPVTVYAPVADEWAAGSAVAAWNAGMPADRQATLVSTPCLRDDPYCIEVSMLPQFDTGAWGNADQMFEGGRMTSCAIQLSEQTSPEYRPGVMAHELGHCLGLPHWAFTESIMSEFASTAGAPSQHDIAWLAASYSQA